MPAEINSEERERAIQFLISEHASLSAAKSYTIFDTGNRTTMFLSAVSSGVVALAFIGQVSEIGFAFYAFALILLPALVILGIFTFLRTLQSSFEHNMYVRGMNRIRHYYIEMAPHIRNYFILSSYDDADSVIRNSAIEPTSFAILLNIASLIAFVTSLLFAILVSLVATAFLGWTMGFTVAAGIVVFIVCMVWQYYYQIQQFSASEARFRVRFPSPTQGSEDMEKM